MEKQNVYKLPVSFTGLCADLDNCDPAPSVLGPLPLDEPILPGYTRYRLTDGVLVDIYMDADEFADWYELNELEIEDEQ